MPAWAFNAAAASANSESVKPFLAVLAVDPVPDRDYVGRSA